MVRQWKEIGLTRHGHQGGSGSCVEELASLVFMLFAALMTLSLFAAIIFFCADGVSKDDSAKSSGTAPNNYVSGAACTAAGCGAGCGGGCGG